jgi:hypothetical protein
MTATIPSTSLVPVRPVFSDAKRLALAGFLAGYRGPTRRGTDGNRRCCPGWADTPRRWRQCVSHSGSTGCWPRRIRDGSVPDSRGC